MNQFREQTNREDREKSIENGEFQAPQVTPGSWLSKYVSVARGLEDQLEPVSTGQQPFHKVIAHATATHVTEQVKQAKPHLDSDFSPGDIHVVSREIAVQDTQMVWRKNSDSDCEIVILTLDTSQLEKAARAFDLSYDDIDFLPCAAGTDPMLYEIMRTLGSELEFNSPSLIRTNKIYSEQLMQMAAVHLIEKYTNKAPISADQLQELPSNRIRRVEDYIRAHLDKDLSLSVLSDQAALSDYHFSRQFKLAVGQSPAAFVRSLRMETATSMLCRDRKKPIAAIAADVGYLDSASFTKAFKRYTGMTPRSYRQNH